jgi:hypothetical protein
MQPERSEGSKNGKRKPPREKQKRDPGFLCPRDSHGRDRAAQLTPVRTIFQSMPRSAGHPHTVPYSVVDSPRKGPTSPSYSHQLRDKLRSSPVCYRFIGPHPYLGVDTPVDQLRRHEVALVSGQRGLLVRLHASFQCPAPREEVSRLQRNHSCSAERGKHRERSENAPTRESGEGQRGRKRIVETFESNK